MGHLKYKEYIGSVEYSEEDKILYGKVLGIRGLISYEGQTIDELEKDFIEGIEQYLSVCDEENIKPQKSYSGAFNIRISSDMHGLAVLKAKEMGINLNTFVKSAIEDKLHQSSETPTRKFKNKGKETVE